MIQRLLAVCRTALFGIAPIEAHLERRGFSPTTADKQRCLEDAGKSFIHGYLSALLSADVDETTSNCELLPPEMRGFGYEGGGMGLALVDLIGRCRPHRFRAFVSGPAKKHIYMAHVGAGWALARCPWGLITFVPRLDPLLKWLTLDGLGFHEGFFNPAKFIFNCASSSKRRWNPEAFDNGLGRAIWFASGARPPIAARTISRFAKNRRGALWSGLGLAAAYAGGADERELATLISHSDGCRDELAVGAAFAAKARVRAGNLTDQTEIACNILCGMSAAAAATTTDECLAALKPGQDSYAYLEWRRSIKKAFAFTA